MTHRSPNSWLPSAPGRIILLAVILAVLLTILTWSIRKNSNENSSNNLNRQDESDLAADVVIPNQELSEIDSDGDGLKDWEEILWQTDLHNPDTDGDGTTDNEEVLVNRDPTIPGPDDKLIVLTGTTTESVDFNSLTQTQKFSRAFISAYLDSKTAGISFTDQIGALSEIAVPEPKTPIRHSVNELAIINDGSAQIIHTYGNVVGGILKKNAPGVSNELIIVLTMFRDNNPELINDLLKISKSYNTNAHELLNVSVPADIAETHIQLINAFLVTARDIELIATFFDDPLVAFAGFESYFNSSEKLVGSLNDLGIYLNKNTKFDKSENGYVLVSDL